MTGKRFEESIGERITRRLRRRREEGASHWYWVGMFGLVGWSVMVPTGIGILLGVLADGARDDRISWTLTGLLVGLVLGCANAWYWVRHEIGGDR